MLTPFDQLVIHLIDIIKNVYVHLLEFTFLQLEGLLVSYRGVNQSRNFERESV